MPAEDGAKVMREGVEKGGAAVVVAAAAGHQEIPAVGHQGDRSADEAEPGTEPGMPKPPLPSYPSPPTCHRKPN